MEVKNATPILWEAQNNTGLFESIWIMYPSWYGTISVEYKSEN